MEMSNIFLVSPYISWQFNKMLYLWDMPVTTCIFKMRMVKSHNNIYKFHWGKGGKCLFTCSTSKTTLGEEASVSWTIVNPKCACALWFNAKTLQISSRKDSVEYRYVQASSLFLTRPATFNAGKNNLTLIYNMYLM